jgi:hypothetical protein
MKTSFSTKTIIVATLLVGIVTAAAAFEIKTSGKKIQTISITGKRMSVEEKRAFDDEAQAMQTVVISTKRLSEEQKQAMLLEDKNAQLVAMHRAARGVIHG